MGMRSIFVQVCAAGLFLSTALHAAPIDYLALSSTYSQNFDTLTNSATVSWTNGTTIPGWHANSFASSVFTTPASLVVTNGTAAIQNTNVYSIGTTSATDRAFGGQSTNSSGSIRHYALQLVNNTGFTLTEFNLAYTGEQWRLIVSDNNDRYDFSYQLFSAGTGTLDTSAGWINADALDFVAPRTTTTGSNTGIDGNAAGNFATVSGTVTGFSWAPGQELWLRWTDPNASNLQRAVLGIDDVSFTAIPEPSMIAMALSGVFCAFFATRRRQQN